MQSSAKVGDFSTQVQDQTIYEFFLDETIAASRQDFERDILKDDIDSVVLFYSSEHVNYF